MCARLCLVAPRVSWPRSGLAWLAGWLASLPHSLVVLPCLPDGLQAFASLPHSLVLLSCLPDGLQAVYPFAIMGVGLSIVGFGSRAMLKVSGYYDRRERHLAMLVRRAPPRRCVRCGSVWVFECVAAGVRT